MFDTLLSCTNKIWLEGENSLCVSPYWLTDTK